MLSQKSLPLRATAALAIALVCLWPPAWAGQQMLLHILMMTILAPAIAYASAGIFRWHRAIKARWLWAATALQMLLFLFWHSPKGMLLGMGHFSGEVLLQGSLLVTACWFWWSMLHQSTGNTWHAILALLLTGKLFCLVAILLTFAPRALYPSLSLADQQLAGLLMITLCPLCYVATAIWLCWRWLAYIEHNNEHYNEQLDGEFFRREMCR